MDCLRFLLTSLVGTLVTALVIDPELLNSAPRAPFALGLDKLYGRLLTVSGPYAIVGGPEPRQTRGE